MSTLSEVRIAMMETYEARISGINVPQDPLPRTIDDKTIVVFPRSQEQTVLSKGPSAGGLGIQTPGIMQVEYHRRIPYEHLGSVMGDVTTMIDTIVDVTWKELIGGKFDGTILNVRGVMLEHFGALGWNEWTFGARVLVAFTYLATVTP